MDNKLYILGIPTNSSLVKPELQQFVDQKLPTIYLHHLAQVENEKNTFNGYNFFVENGFIDGTVDNITEEQIQENKVLTVCPAFYLGKNRNNSHKGAALKLIEIVKSLKTKFPNSRIAYLTHSSPYLFNEMVSILQDVNTDLDIEVIDCDTFQEESIESFFRVGKIIGQEEMSKPYLRSVIPPYDRSGIFFNNSSPTIPSNTFTEKSFEQITDETALTYSNKNVLIAWSGGIDSTTVVASFIKNNIPFKVTVNARAESENKQLYDYLIDNHETVVIPDDMNLSELDSSYLIVTGDCADQLSPGIQHNFIPGGIQFRNVVGYSNFNEDYKSYFDTPVEQKYLYNNARESFVEWYSKYYKCSDVTSQGVYDNYLLPYIQKFPFEVKHFYQLRWFFRFIFQYEVTSKQQFVNFTKCKNKVQAFFDTEDYQRWAITNLDYNWNNYSTHYNNYKMMQKQYNYDVFGFDNLLTQIKYPSLN